MEMDNVAIQLELSPAEARKLLCILATHKDVSVIDNLPLWRSPEMADLYNKVRPRILSAIPELEATE